MSEEAPTRRTFTHVPSGRSVVALEGTRLESLVVADPNWTEGDSRTSDSAPDESWKVAELKSWAEAHDVDLGGARSKVDILAAISDPDNAKTVSPDEGLPVIPADPSLDQTDLPE